MRLSHPSPPEDDCAKLTMASFGSLVKVLYVIHTAFLRDFGSFLHEFENFSADLDWFYMILMREFVSLFYAHRFRRPSPTHPRQTIGVGCISPQPLTASPHVATNVPTGDGAKS